MRRSPAAILQACPIAILCASHLLSCAGQIAPSGGPVDTVPPVILRTLPDSNAVRVSTDGIELEFSKYVDRRSVEESIFISPYVGTLEFDWSGRTVRAAFSEPLRRNTTYVVNIGTDIRDVRAGNRMAHGYTLAFATGDSIDRALIAGKVFDEKPEGVMVFAYALKGIEPDTLDPTHTRPDYIQQTGADGTYELAHLAFGRYRVIAVRDEYRNLFYDRQVDAYGVWRSDVEVTAAGPAVRGVSFRLAKEDTARPFLSSARSLEGQRVAVRFSEPVDTLRLAQGSFSVTDTVSGRSLSVASWYLDFTQPAEAGLSIAGAMDSGAVYRVRAAGFEDHAGNSVDSVAGTTALVFLPSPDTTRPSLTLSVRDSTRDVPGGLPLALTFSEPVVQRPVAGGVRLLDSSRTPVSAMLLWRGGVAAALQTQGGLQPAAWYTLEIVMDSLRDFGGNTYTDSVRSVRFRTADIRLTGVIEGEARVAPPRDTPLEVTATALDLNPPARRHVRLARPGPFQIERLPEGRYVLDAFAVADSAAGYRFGLPHPFAPSAPFGVYPDTVRVRARWGMQGVLIDVR